MASRAVNKVADKAANKVDSRAANKAIGKADNKVAGKAVSRAANKVMGKTSRNSGNKRTAKTNRLRRGAGLSIHLKGIPMQTKFTKLIGATAIGSAILLSTPAISQSSDSAKSGQAQTAQAQAQTQRDAASPTGSSSDRRDDNMNWGWLGLLGLVGLVGLRRRDDTYRGTR